MRWKWFLFLSHCIVGINVCQPPEDVRYGFLLQKTSIVGFQHDIWKASFQGNVEGTIFTWGV